MRGCSADYQPVRVSIERQGGVMGGAWSAQVTNDAVTTQENGGSPAAGPLTPEQAAELGRMVDAVLVAPRPAPAPARHVPDGMRTTLDVRNGRRRRRLQIYSGAKAGTEVLDLIRAVREVARTAEVAR